MIRRVILPWIRENPIVPVEKLSGMVDRMAWPSHETARTQLAHPEKRLTIKDGFKKPAVSRSASWRKTTGTYDPLKLERQVATMAKNINKDTLVHSIVGKTELSKKDVEAVIEAMTDSITYELKSGNKVTLTGFGTFKVSNRKAREGINPQTKAKIHIPAMSVPKFTAGKTLKEAVK